MMFFNLEAFLMLGIFFKEIAVADSFYGELIDLGKGSGNNNNKHNLSNYEFGNCSSYSIAYGSSCTCFECTEERCTICCNTVNFRCCYCHTCSTSCWNNNWQLISAAQVGLSTALLIATVATIALFFRICNGGFQAGQQANSLPRDTPRISVSSIQQYVIQRLQNRPPQYNDSSDAPPVYDTDPANMVPTTEAPPRYTRKPQETETINVTEPASVLDRQTASPTIVPSAPLPPTTNHM